MNVTVVHSGALGDCVLLWPLLRSLTRAGHLVRLVDRAEQAHLSAAELSLQVGRACVAGESIEGVVWNGLWRGEVVAVDDSCGLLISCLADETTAGGCVWMEAARRAHPGAEVVAVGGQWSVSRRELIERFEVERLGCVPLHGNPGGPVVLSVGAGGESKRWPLERWVELAEGLVSGNVVLLRGPVEVDRFTPAERRVWEDAAGVCDARTCASLSELADMLRGARVVVSADSGPGHLAAQLGVPTVSLFGPTDPGLWQPIGPRVRVIAPPSCTPDMTWLEVERVARVLAGP